MLQYSDKRSRMYFVCVMLPLQSCQAATGILLCERYASSAISVGGILHTNIENICMRVCMSDVFLPIFHLPVAHLFFSWWWLYPQHIYSSWMRCVSSSICSNPSYCRLQTCRAFCGPSSQTAGSFLLTTRKLNEKVDCNHYSTIEAYSREMATCFFCHNLILFLCHRLISFTSISRLLLLCNVIST